MPSPAAMLLAAGLALAVIGGAKVVHAVHQAAHKIHQVIHHPKD
jgi:hypothetical protein